MPVPKRKVSKARRDQRQSTKFIRAQAYTICNHCESPLNTHQACLECGYYKGKKVMTSRLDKKIKKAEKQQAAHAAQQKAMAAQQKAEQSAEPSKDSDESDASK
jgi:large subunit ribosomal protein L32